MPAKCPECHFDLSKGKVVPEKLFAEIKCPNCGYVFNPTTLSNRKWSGVNIDRSFGGGGGSGSSSRKKK
ncbi:MAG: hypothetical protein H7839_11615 [Magnetococcus sp. YQC-5]